MEATLFQPARRERRRGLDRPVFTHRAHTLQSAESRRVSALTSPRGGFTRPSRRAGAGGSARERVLRLVRQHRYVHLDGRREFSARGEFCLASASCCGGSSTEADLHLPQTFNCSTPGPHSTRQWRPQVV